MWWDGQNLDKPLVGPDGAKWSFRVWHGTIEGVHCQRLFFWDEAQAETGLIELRGSETLHVSATDCTASVAYRIDTHRGVAAFVENAGLGFGIRYLHNGQDHEYLPDFVVRLKTTNPAHLILETKGYDPLADVKLADVKRAAALRGCAAVTAEGRFGHRYFRMARAVGEVNGFLDAAPTDTSG